MELEKHYGRHRVTESIVPFVGISKHGYTPQLNDPEHQGYGVSQWSALFGQSDRATNTWEQYYLEKVLEDVQDEDQEDREEGQDPNRTNPHQIHTPEIAETEQYLKELQISYRADRLFHPDAPTPLLVDSAEHRQIERTQRDAENVRSRSSSQHRDNLS